MFKSSGKWIIALSAAAVAVAGFGIFLALRPPGRSPAPQAGASVSTQMGGRVAALGRLEPGGEVFCVSPPSTSSGAGRVLRLLVKDGDPVKQNQMIAVMDTYDRLLAAGYQAQAQVQEAQLKVAQVRAGKANQAEVQAQQEQVRAQQALIAAKEAEVDQRTAELRQADNDFKRYTALRETGAISQADLEQYQLKRQTAQAALQRSVREQEQLVRGREQLRQMEASLLQSRPVDVQQAEAQVQVAVANLQRAKAELETAAVRSPITGRVIKVHAKESEQVKSIVASGSSSECNGIAEVGKTDQMYAVAEIYETDIARVRPGQRASITSPAFPQTLSGRVERIGQKVGKNDVLNTDPAANTDARVVEVKVRLDDSRPVAGLTNLEVNVTIEPG